MIAWPDFARDAATATPAGDVDWPRTGSRLPVAPPPEAAITEAPLAGQEPHPPADAALDEKPVTETAQPRRRRRWPMTAALVLSLAAHAAMAFWLAERMSRPGMEAATDAISVEIVLEQAAPAETAAVAGAAQSSEGGDEGRPRETPAETLARAPPDEPPAEAPPDAALAEVETGGFAVEALPDDAPPQVPPDQHMPEASAETTEPAVAEERLEAHEALEEAEPEQPVAPTESDRERLAEIAHAEAAAPVEPAPPEAEPFASPGPSPPLLAVIEPEPATPPVVLPSPADDIPLELVPVPMPRPERPVEDTARQRAAQPAPKRSEAARRKTQEGAAARAPESRTTQPRREQAEPPKARQRAETGPARAQKAGNAARSASSAGAVAGYARKVNRHLQRHKRYPAQAARLKGAVRLAVTIDRAGRLLGAHVSGGSGHAVLDSEAVATAKRAAPYPPPPDGVGGRSLTLAFILRYGR